MLVALDPGLFSVDAGTTSDNLRLRIDSANAALATLTKGGAQVIRSVGNTNVWNVIYAKSVQALKQLKTPELDRSLDRLRCHAEAGCALPEPAGSGKCYGARAMFTHASLPAPQYGWLQLMERVLFAGALANKKLYLVTTHVVGRNIVDQSANGVELKEVTRFRLYVAVKGAPPRAVECVTRARHVDVPWTARVDVRLPSARDGARCPFCPPPAWERFATQVWRTHSSRPCWIDANGNAWARPRIPNGYHWDVYLAQQLSDRIGLDQLNIVEFGAKSTQGSAGSLHHVPAGKRAHLKDQNPRWNC